jgi:hypothetical protein
MSLNDVSEGLKILAKVSLVNAQHAGKRHMNRLAHDHRANGKVVDHVLS